MLISNGDLTWMRATQELAQPGTVVIERYTYTSDGQGGYSEVWAAVGTAVGRISPMVRRGASEIVAGAQVISETSWFATFPVGTNVTAKDRLRYNSRTWEVMRVNNDEMWQTAVRCELSSQNEEARS